MSLDPRLREFCATDRQLEIFDAVIKEGGPTKAAEALHIRLRNVQYALARIKKNATLRGYAPDHDQVHPVPEGQYAKGVSTYYGPDGEVKGQWVKSSISKEQQQELMLEAVKAMSETLKKEKPVKAPKLGNVDLLNCYVITDYHLGMLSWAEETSNDWDTEIAENLLVSWFMEAVKSSPNADKALLIQLGDFLHFDSLEAITPQNKHLLDADTRFQRVVRIAIRALRRVVRVLLEKHSEVHLIMAEGNHDIASSIWLREMFTVLYEDEPRITVDRSPDPYYCYEHGLTAIFCHHGHKRRVKDIDDVFVAKFREVFGRTKHAYAHMGHMHHVDVKETNLMIVEQHRTLAGHDAYASRGGWLAGRDAKCITYHKAYGEVARLTINPDMIK